MTTLVVRQTTAFHFLSKVSAFLNEVIANSAKARASQAAAANTRSQDIDNLNRLARKYENIQPNLAAELRCLAARG